MSRTDDKGFMVSFILKNWIHTIQMFSSTQKFARHDLNIPLKNWNPSYVDDQNTRMLIKDSFSFFRTLGLALT